MERVRGAAPVGVVVAGIAVTAVLLGFSPTLNPVDALLGRGAVVDLPDVSGRTRPVAQVELDALGLRTAVRTSFSLTVRRGTVITQEPRPDSRVREGSTVTLVVSRGANRVPMPDAVGKPFREVSRPLRAADIPMTVERVSSETAARGVVIAQRPGPGVVVTGDDRVSFTVSKGADPRPVPAVAGLLLEGAAYQLGRAGLQVGTLTPVDDPNVPEGAVVASNPAPGTVVPKDTAVVLSVSQGKPPVAVPDLVGQTQVNAVAALGGLGLVPNPISQDQAAASDGGPVVAQDPPARTTLRPGSVVTITIGPTG